MRVTRYLWITNLPSNTSEGDVRELLQSHGKIQSVRIHPNGSSFGAVVAFMDTKSATRAIESTIFLHQTRLSLRYCESSGIPSSVCQGVMHRSPDTSNNNISMFQSDVTDPSMDNSIADDSSVSEESNRNRSHNRVHRSSSPAESLTCSPEKGFSKCRSKEQRGLHIRHLPLRSSDTNLRDGLFHEYKKHGKITSVVIQGHGEDRFCLLTFKRPEDAERAFELSRGKVFFGTQIYVSLHDGIDSEDPDLCPPEHALDEHHPKATKTLFVGNLSSDSITQEALHKMFRMYGDIIEIDIKVQTNQPGTSYAFVQFNDIKSVVRALQDQDTIRIDAKCVKLGFGKSQPTNVAWLDNLASSVNETFLTRLFGRYGHLTHVVFDPRALRALLYFDTVEMAQRALNETRNRTIMGRKVQLDFAGYECQVDFMRRLSHSEGITDVLATYKERLQELFTAWPSCGVPTERHRFSKDNHSATCDSADNSSNRGSSRRFQPSACPSTSLQGTPRKRGNSSRRSPVAKSHAPRRKSETNNDISSDRYKASRSDASVERSMSPVIRKSRGRVPPFSYAGIQKISRPDSHPFVPNEARSHRYPQPSSVDSKHESLISLNNENKSAQLTKQNKTHYLDETDEVSSGSLSDLDASDVSSEHSSPGCHPSSQCADTNGRSTHVDTRFLSRSDHPRHRDSKYTGLPKGSQNPAHRHKTNPLVPVEFSRTPTSIRTNCTQPKAHKPIPQSISSNDMLHPRHYSIRDKSTESLKCRSNSNANQYQRCDQSTKSTDNSNGIPEAEFVSKTKDLHSRHLCYSKSSRNCRSNRLLHVNSMENVSAVKQVSGSRDCSDDKTSRVISSSQSHDALTKLEQERAKLLKELSILNNEVVNGNKIKPTRDSPSRNSKSEITMESAVQKIRRKEASCGISVSMAASDTVSKSSTLTVAPGVDQSITTPKRFIFAHDDAQSQNSNAHSNINDSVTMFSPTTANVRSTKLESPSHSASVSTCVTGNILHAVVTNVGALSSAGESTCCSSTRTPTFIVPPEPNSPLSGLSPPGSPFRIIGASAFDVRPHFPVPDSSFSVRITDVRPQSFKPENFPTRDPRLSIHYAHQTLDVPPPPPENLKLPLWVDTSASIVTNSLRNPLSTVLHPCEYDPVYRRFDPRSSNDVDSEMCAQPDHVTRSLEERIRLLDVQLMKSEKVRPAVDYSKFRIRRKTDANAPGNSMAHPNSISNVSSLATGDLPPSSPITTIQGAQVEQVLTPEASVSTPTLSVTFTSTISNSPASVFSNSPLTLPRPADTSEFVKSMLSAKPTAVSCSQNPTSLMNSTAVAVRSSILPYGNSPISSPAQLSTIADCVVQEKSRVDVADVHNSLIHRSFGTLGSRFLPSVASAGGLQPVGVATRLPVQSSPFDVNSVLRGSCIEDSSALKPILKRDHDDYVGVSANSLTMLTTVPEVSKPSDVFHRSMAFPVSHFDTKRNTSVISVLSAKPTSTFSTEYARMEPKDPDAYKTSRTRRLSSNTVDVFGAKFSGIKSQKIDTVRSSSSSTVLSCFDPVFSKSVSKGRLNHSKKANRRSKEASQSMNCDKIDAKVHVQKELNIREQILANRTPIFEKHGFILSGKLRSPNSSFSNNVPDVGMDGRRGSSVRSKVLRSSTCKRRKKLKDAVSLPDSDSIGDFVDTSKQQMTDTTELHYESMYDKIKRRASKGGTIDSDSSKQSNIKRKTAISTKSNSRKAIRRPQLLADSDTDECYSESSISNSEALKLIGGTKAARLCHESPEIPSSASKPSKMLDFSDPSYNKKNTTSFSSVRGRKSKKTTNDSRCHVPTNSTQSKLNTRKRATNTIGSKRGANMRDLGNAVSMGITVSKRKHCTASRSNFAETGGVSKRKRLGTIGRPQSLVHRVFASTDSDTPSSLSSTDDESIKNEVKRKKSHQNEPMLAEDGSQSLVSHCSRSCSPEDLGVDDAARHTFGAFNTPFSVSSKESLCTSASTSVSSPKRFRQAKILSGSSINTSRATPSTLPMCESGSSAGRVSDHSIETSSHEPACWNLFTSLEKHSTPKQLSPLIDQSKSPECTYTEYNRSVSETEDDLPSLEKHDHDSEKIDGDSLLLNDTSGFSHPDNLVEINNDDLPPPVVPAVNDLSPVVRNSVELTGDTADVVEEIVYDGLELQLQNSEQSAQIACHDINVSKNSAQHPTLGDHTSLSSESVMRDLSVQLPLPLSTPSEKPLTVNHDNLSSIVSHSGFVPIVPQLSDRSSMAQPLLVTVPTANTNARFPSSNLTLLPTSLSFFPAPSSSSGSTQRHIAVILPSAPVSVNSSTVQLPSTQSSFAGPTFVLKTAPSDVCGNLRLPSISVTSDVSCATRHVPETSINPGMQVLKSNFGDEIANFAAVALNNSMDGSSYITTPVTSATGFIIDRPDFTSYVQRVIERVKQEKDEEVIHQRERVKRSKKTNLPISVSSLVNISPSPITVMAPPVILPSTTRLTPIAPMPAVSGAALTLRSSVVINKLSQSDKTVNIFNNIHVVPTAEIISSTHPLLGVPSSESSENSDATINELRKSESANHTCVSTSMARSGTNVTTTDVTAEQLLTQQVSYTSLKNPDETDTVDNTIEAVANGEFDETIYQQKIIKGTFDRTEVFDSMASLQVSVQLCSSPFPDSHETVPVESIDPLDGDFEQPETSKPSECTSNGSAVNITIQNPCNTTSELTPMHVLTLVATCSPSLSIASAISPGIPGTSCSIPVSSSKMLQQQLLPVVSEVHDKIDEIPKTSCPPATSAVTVSNPQLEQFAAHFANNPIMMGYFSSLLAQQQNQSITSGTSVASEPYNNSFEGSATQTSFLPQALLKPSQGNNSVDYLTAATMAAMVAMAPLKVVTTSREAMFNTARATDTISITDSALTPIPQFSTPLVTESNVQCFPLIWRGRLLLKNEEAHVQLHYINGSRDIFGACMNVIREQQQIPTNEPSISTDGERSMSHVSSGFSLPQPLRIAQRMRLDTSQLEGVCRKLRQVGDFCMCLAMATAPLDTPESSACTERARMNQVLRDAFINYLTEKCAAGIINVCHTHTQQNLFVIHIFPPCDFSRSQLQLCAPALLNDLSHHSTPHMLIVITTV